MAQLRSCPLSDNEATPQCLEGLGVEVFQIPVLSTAHLTKATNDLLYAGPSAWHPHWFHHCAGYEFGWFLSVPTEEFQQANDPASPADIQAVMTWARKHGFGWIRLDSDGSVTNELPTYDW